MHTQELVALRKTLRGPAPVWSHSVRNHLRSTWTLSRFAPFLIWMCLGCYGESAEPQPVDLCELFRGLQSIQTEMIVVKGGFQLGRHGAALIETNCGFRFEAGSRSWPTALHITSPGWEFPGEPSVRYTLDSTGENLWRLLVSLARSEENRVRIVATIEGELRVGKAFRAVSSNDGYGPFGSYPGELVMKAIRHVEISVTPKGKE